MTAPRSRSERPRESSDRLCARPFSYTAPVRSPLRLSFEKNFELCRAAKRAWKKMPGDERMALFEWDGRKWFVTGGLFGIRVWDSSGREVTGLMFW